MRGTAERVEVKSRGRTNLQRMLATFVQLTVPTNNIRDVKKGYQNKVLGSQEWQRFQCRTFEIEKNMIRRRKYMHCRFE